MGEAAWRRLGPKAVGSADGDVAVDARSSTETEIGVGIENFTGGSVKTTQVLSLYSRAMINSMFSYDSCLESKRTWLSLTQENPFRKFYDVLKPAFQPSLSLLFSRWYE